MALKVLVETGFLIALNPRDKYHKWALDVLAKAKRKDLILNISPAALLEYTLLLKTKGYDEETIHNILEAINDIIQRYTRPLYPQLTLNHVIYATKLRRKYSELSFFDSIHASITILDNLIYYDLDNVVKRIIRSELSIE